MSPPETKTPEPARPLENTATPSSAPLAAPQSVAPRSGRWRWIVGLVVLIAVIVAGTPWLLQVLSTVSTDDAYVNGHVTFVAARVPGQVTRVLVDDNNRVHKGDLIVQLDKEPYQVQLDIAQAAVNSAQADLIAKRAEIRAAEGTTRSLRFNLEHAIEDVDNQVAVLRSKVATLDSRKASLARAQADYDRI